jgi:hypothetical protein
LLQGISTTEWQIAIQALKQNISIITFINDHSDWTKNRALLNKAQRWVKEAAEDIREKLPFPIKGTDSENGSKLKYTVTATVSIMDIHE